MSDTRSEVDRPITAATLSAGRTAAFGALLVALGPISMALYTPAMPALVAAFATDARAIGWTLTIYFAGFALAQLVCGPLSDAFGRRPVVLGFLLLYVAGSFVALVAPTVEAMMVARLVQGIGAAAGIAISRAIVRDNFTGRDSERIMNAIGIWLALGPAVSPTLGGLILIASGWQAIFLAMAFFGLALLGVFAMALPETNRSPDPARVRPAGLARTYLGLVLDRRFLKPSLIIGLTVGGLYALGTMLPFLLIDRVGLTPMEFGLAMLLQSGSFIIGGLVTRRLIGRIDAARLVRPGLVLCASGGLAMAVCVSTFGPNILSVMLPVAVFAFSLALIMPHLSTSALAPFPQTTGAAAALMGFLQMGCGFAGSGVAALLGDPVLAFALAVPAMAASALLIELSS